MGEQKWLNVVEKIFNLDDYVNVNFNIGVTESSTLTNNKI